MSMTDDIIDELECECYRLKVLLQRALPEIRMRGETLQGCWPGPEIQHLVHRNQCLLTDIERALEDWETDDPS